MNTETDLWVAQRGAMITMEGSRVAVGRGDVARDGHPILAAAPGLFTRLRVRFDVAPDAQPPAPKPQASRPAAARGKRAAN